MTRPAFDRKLVPLYSKDIEAAAAEFAGLCEELAGFYASLAAVPAENRDAFHPSAVARLERSEAELKTFMPLTEKAAASGATGGGTPEAKGP